MTINMSLYPFRPNHIPKPATDTRRHYNQTFLDYGDLLTTINNTAPLIEILVLKHARLYLGEVGQ